MSDLHSSTFELQCETRDWLLSCHFTEWEDWKREINSFHYKSIRFNLKYIQLQKIRGGGWVIFYFHFQRGATEKQDAKVVKMDINIQKKKLKRNLRSVTITWKKGHDIPSIWQFKSIYIIKYISINFCNKIRSNLENSNYVLFFVIKIGSLNTLEYLCKCSWKCTVRRKTVPQDKKSLV